MTHRILLLALFAFSMLAADITGNWTFHVDLGAQSGSPKFTFQQKGEVVTGTYTGQLGESKLKGTVTGDIVEFQFETAGIDVVYTGTIVSATGMKGKCDYGGQGAGTWTAKKD